MSLCLASAPRSACVIWPIFSSVVILLSRSATRSLTGLRAFRYGNPCALITMTGGSAGGLVPVPDSSTGMVSATSFWPSWSVLTVNVLAEPDAVPAGNVRVPSTGV
jgi:hypothetical protein